MGENVEKEGDVMLYATKVVVQEASMHAADDAIPSRCAGRVLDEEGVKVGLNDHAAVRSSIKADARTDTVTTDVQHTGIGSKVSGRILGGNTALHGDAAGYNVLLVETNLLERGATGNEEGGLHDVDSGDLLGDCVLDLHTRIDLHEIVLAVFIDEELDGAGARVLAGHRQLKGVLQDILADAHRVMPRRGDLNSAQMRRNHMEMMRKMTITQIRAKRRSNTNKYLSTE